MNTAKKKFEMKQKAEDWGIIIHDELSFHEHLILYQMYKLGFWGLLIAYIILQLTLTFQ